MGRSKDVNQDRRSPDITLYRCALDARGHNQLNETDWTFRQSSTLRSGPFYGKRGACSVLLNLRSLRHDLTFSPFFSGFRL
jgi:hypothetical protein